MSAATVLRGLLPGRSTAVPVIGPPGAAAPETPFWRTLYDWSRPQRRVLAVASSLAAVVGVLSALQPLCVKWIVDNGLLRKHDYGLGLSRPTDSADESIIFDDLAVTIERGQSVALVGPSGSGKNTFTAMLLLRLYDARRDSIRLNGVPIDKCALADLRAGFGVVPQDPFLFKGTIRDNLIVTRPAADPADVRRATKLALVSEFVDRLPGGVSTVLGEAHHLSTIRQCDRVLVFDQGRIVQDGPYAMLAHAPGLFQGMLHQAAGGDFIKQAA